MEECRMNVVEKVDEAVKLVTGNELLVRELLRQGADTGFFLMGGPMTPVESLCIEAGIRMIDVRHEQAAALMAQAYGRLRGKPAFCMACSGPGTINLATGLANAFVDGVPLVAFGGSSPVAQFKMQAFQEVDQVAVMRPITKWAERVYEAHRIPEYVDMAFKHAMSGKPGPVYLDLPGDVLFQKVDERETFHPRLTRDREVSKPQAPDHAISTVVDLVRKAERPIILSGTGILWSGASESLRRFVELAGIPFYTTPQGRGVVPEDHELAFLTARSSAMREADFVLVVGTRLNYIFGFGAEPRLRADATIVQIDSDPEELSRSGTINYGIVGDARLVLDQLHAALDQGASDRFAPWRKHLGEIDEAGQKKQEKLLNTDQMPIHPLRLCKEVADFMDRDAILVVDGQEILNYGRQSIPTFTPGHRLNSGPLGTMGVGLPFGIGAKAAKPDKQVIVLHGDGSFGVNAMELDVAVRHKLPILVIISLNGGWTSDPKGEKAGSRLGYTRFDKIAEALGCYGEMIERPEDIRPALERGAKAVAAGQTALINVVTDSAARAKTARFSHYRT
jgi:acetolactate synthase-1/2/3 large subunit